MFGALALKLVTPLRIQRAQEGFGVTIICDIAKHTNTLTKQSQEEIYS